MVYRRPHLTLLFALALAACGPTTADDEGDGLDAGAGGGGEAGSIDQVPPGQCSDEAKLVYVVDENNTFSSFNPRPQPPEFVDLGTLSCPAADGATPFSMSVDRHAVAWVLYNSGELFRVEFGGLSCSATSFAPNQQGMLTFGMGFVSNSAGSADETLFIAGITAEAANNMLATLDPTTLVVSPVQLIAGSPELTGTGSAELWGFFPETASPRVARLNKTTGASDPIYPLPDLAGEPAAWAFAFWGGDFWVFLMRQTDQDTGVYRVKGTDGTMTVALATTGRRIVGAGVSTCAPIVIE